MEYFLFNKKKVTGEVHRYFKIQEKLKIKITVETIKDRKNKG